MRMCANATRLLHINLQLDRSFISLDIVIGPSSQLRKALTSPTHGYYPINQRFSTWTLLSRCFEMKFYL